MRVVFLALVLLFLAGPARAEQKADNAARYEVRSIPELPAACSSSPYGEVCLHTFGGMRTRIPLPDTKGFSCGEIQAHLLQLSSQPAMPVGKPVPLDPDSCKEVILPLPAVKEKTIFRVLFTITGSASARFPDMMLQNTLVAVYPDDLWAPLREWSEKNSLVVNDRGAKLTSLLEQEHIRYSLMELPDQDRTVRHLCVWVPVSEAAADASCTPLIILHEKAEGLPMIRTLRTPDRTRVDVYMPLLAGLSAHPLLQQTFIDLVQSSLRGD